MAFKKTLQTLLIPLESIGVESKKAFLQEVIDNEVELFFLNSKVHWLIAKEEGQVIGLLILDLTDYPKVNRNRDSKGCLI